MKAPNGGMLWVDRVGDRGSCVILTQNFPEEERPKYKTEGTEAGGLFMGAISRSTRLSFPETMP
jgi:hypothetical protein